MRKTRQAVELKVNLFLRFLQKTAPTRQILAKHRSKSSFSTGNFLPEPVKIGKTVRFLLSD
jgi:hypothetical protein